MKLNSEWLYNNNNIIHLFTSQHTNEMINN